MKIHTLALLIVTHCAVASLGFGLGIYTLPILIAPTAPSKEIVNTVASQALFTATFRKDLKDSDFLHWGEGSVSISTKAIALSGKLAPGPDYKLYLSPKFIETEAEFYQLKSSMLRVGDINTFNNFVLKIPPGIDPNNYSAVIIWCEAFNQFITSAQYQ